MTQPAVDLSQMSDEDLAALAGQGAPTAITAMSDAELQKLADQQAMTHKPVQPNTPFVDAATDPSAWLAGAERTAGLGARAAIQGVAAVPTMAEDAGVAIRNIVTGHVPLRNPDGSLNWKMMADPSATELPSTTQDRALTALGLPEPHGLGERLPSIGISALAGGAVPGGTPTEIGGGAPLAPASFVNPERAKALLLAQSLKKAQDQGLVIPPSTTNPTLRNVTTETIAGKENTQNWVRRANDVARTRMASQELGLNPDAPLTPGAVAAVKQEAGQGMNAAANIGQFQHDDQYLQDLTNVLKENQGANARYPGAANPDAEKVVDTYLQPTSDGQAATSAIKLLRAKADDAYRGGNSEMGRVYKGIAVALQNQLERVAPGPIVPQLKASRELYAKASAVHDAMLPDGTVTGPALAAALRNGEPFTGNLRTAAEFAQNYPKANLSSAKSGSPVNHLTAVGAAGGAGVGALLAEHLGPAAWQHPEAAIPAAVLGLGVYPAARSIARRSLMSPSGQERAIPAAAGGPLGMPGLTPQQLAAGLATFNQSASGRPGQ